jgi:hypothetical protein
MNAALDHLPGTGFAPDPRQLRRVAAGIAVSLALHALLLSVYRQPLPAPAASTPEPLTVRLRPAVPPAQVPVPVPVPVPAPDTQALPRQAKPVRPVKRTRPAHPGNPARPAQPVIAVAAGTPPPGRGTVAGGTAPTAAPTLDINAARSLAHRLAREPDPTKAGTALERLPPKPLETETRAARAIGAAKRADCKDGIPGGLLAPLYLMMDKKDSGCKW